MTCVSMAQAARHLGIDVKTLRRWLTHAQLPLQSHPGDGRKKGMSYEHLQALAHLHQRSLAPLSQEPPAPVECPMLPLPAALLAVPERIDALQAQLAALQQQVIALTHLLQQHESASASPAAPTKPTRTAKPPSKPTPPASRSRRAVKPPRKPVHVIPRVEYGEQGHYVVICPKQGVLPFEPDTEAWFAWLAKQSSFRFVGIQGRLTAHHESGRVPKGAWRAHRQIRNHSYTLRLAPAHELTIAVLEQAAEALQAYLT